MPTTKTFVIDGIEYEPVTAIPGKRAVVVVDRGWVFAGDVAEKDGRIYLTRAVWVFRWESLGFAGVIESPKNKKVDIRKISDINIPAGAEVFRVSVDDQWGL